jgi:broad specificity phosphatase PhoE
MHKILYLYRHGETDLNRHGIVQGSGVDAGLNERGKEQARAFYHHYKDAGFEVVLTSALRRTRETAQPFIEAGMSWEVFTDINEVCWGEHEGKKSTPEMVQEYKEVLKRWESGDLRAALKQGESAAEMTARLIRFAEWLKARPEKKLLICSHGRAMRCLLCILKGDPPSMMDQFHHGNTALYVVHFRNNKFEFEIQNDLSHLEDLLT